MTEFWQMQVYFESEPRQPYKIDMNLSNIDINSATESR